ncbi:MAG TPA: inverse autotransporter beta domain-containing protein [Alphaproteobacteria bacterium]|nr:inverse autotransporter beta domain-containing protein [Alphaproteobacteria bacterium]
MAQAIRRSQAGCAAIAVAMLAMLLGIPAAAQTGPSSPLKWGPFLDLDGKVGTKRNLGTGDLFMPMLQDSNSLLFADIRGRFDDHSDEEGNFGLGVRHMLESGWNLGAYSYYDRRKTELGTTFEQATFGIEALSLDWDLRANVYQPIGSSVRNASTSSNTSTSSTATSTAALADTAVQVTTTTTTTNRTTTVTTQDVEQKGFDAEIGWRVPVFAAIDTTQLRVYAGGYRFYADNTRATQGPRGRINLTIDEVPHLWEGARLDLGGEVQNDGPRGTQAFAEVRLRIPLQIFGQRPAALTAMERRMEDPIVRDVDIVDQSHAATATATTSTSSSVVETATQTSGGSAITVLSSSTTTGANLPTAVANAGANSTVILTGTFNTTAVTTLQSGQTLMGAGSLTVTTPSGRTATLTTSAATISNTTTASVAAVDMANNSTLTGMTINQTGSGGSNPFGVQATGVSGATITNNTISTTSTGGGTAFGIRILGASTNITVSGNTATAANASAVSVAFQLNGSGGSVSATVSGNTFSATGVTPHAAQVDGVGNTATVLSGSTGNVKTAGDCTSGATTSGSISFTDGSHCP